MNRHAEGLTGSHAPLEANQMGPRTQAMIGEILAEFPDFAVIPKRQSRLQRSIDVLLRIVTLGGQRRYISGYHTVLGYRLYVADCWPRMSDVQKAILLRHERVHLRQRRRLGFVAFAFLYLFPVFPLGLAYGRARLEWEAYRETIAATAEWLGLEHLDIGLREELVQRFVGPDYGWMWPFPATVRAWFAEAVEQERNRRDRSP